MELMQQVKGYSDSREREEEEEEEEEEEATEIIRTTREETNRLLQQQDAAAGNSNFMMNDERKQQHELDLMELSVGRSSSKRDEIFQQERSGAEAEAEAPVEKEHMFDKVVTPSDVGKLNRLVIPKQHAEKYFPLDSSSNEKGLLLNFEDRNGKLWRFRYSYWNSSQSYVMTKGWSRFVKEKKLDAGDIVSFQRGLGEFYRHRLYIDWRTRDHHHHPAHPSISSLITPLFLHPNHHHYSIRWGGSGSGSGSGSGRLYLPSLPPPPPPPPPTTTSSTSSINVPPPHHHNNYNHIYPPPPFLHQQHHYHPHHNSYNEFHNSGSAAAGSVYYLRPTTRIMSMSDHNLLPRHQHERGIMSVAPMIIDSVPVAHHHHHHHDDHDHGGRSATSPNSSTTGGKRLRLFGVNMECASSSPLSVEESEDQCLPSASEANVTITNSLPSSSLPPTIQLQQRYLRHGHGHQLSSSRFGDHHQQ